MMLCGVSVVFNSLGNVLGFMSRKRTADLNSLSLIMRSLEINGSSRQSLRA
jgi:hypothetical protein